jgi:hypothetical protein
MMGRLRVGTRTLCSSLRSEAITTTLSNRLVVHSSHQHHENVFSHRESIERQYKSPIASLCENDVNFSDRLINPPKHITYPVWIIIYS